MLALPCPMLVGRNFFYKNPRLRFVNLQLQHVLSLDYLQKRDPNLKMGAAQCFWVAKHPPTGGTVFLGGKTPSNRRRKRATHFGSEPTRDACLRPPSVLLRLHRAESGPLEGDSRSCARVLRRGCWRPEILRCVTSLLPATQTHEWVSYLGWLVGDSLSTAKLHISIDKGCSCAFI